MSRMGELERRTLRALRVALLAMLPVLGVSCAGTAGKDRNHVMMISVPEQKMAVFREGVKIKEYKVSTSKFGVGDQPGSNRTPLGRMEVAAKIGEGARPGTVFKSRRPTGEVVAVDAPGRDPIVTRILWLRGLEDGNRNAFGRCIYIHGTPEERNIGVPVSYGCIRMRSKDVVQLCRIVGEGARVDVTMNPLPRPFQRATQPAAPVAAPDPGLIPPNLAAAESREPQPSAAGRPPLVINTAPSQNVRRNTIAPADRVSYTAWTPPAPPQSAGQNL